MIKKIAILLTTCAFISSCEQSSSKERYIKGYKAVTHVSTNGKTPEVGDYVFFDLDIITDKGEVIDKSPRGDDMPVLQIMAEADIPDKSNPVVELMSGMAIGDSVSLYIPIDSIPGPPPNMIGSEYLEYVVKTRKIMTEDEFTAEAKKRQEEEAMRLQEAMAEAPKILAGIESTLKDYLAGKEVGEIKEGPDGLKIIITEPGEGPTANDGQYVSVSYAGYLEDLTNFDNSYKRGSPYKLSLGRGSVIQGWDKGLVYLNKGAKAILDIPSDLGYGAGGSPPRIPGNSRLLFFVEMTDIN